MLEIYTDGSCLGNESKEIEGKGGYSCVFVKSDEYWVISKSESNTTNNRMEIKSVILALENLSNKSQQIQIYSDSNYVVQGCNSWRIGWEKRNYKQVKNYDLWKQLFSELDKVQDYKITHIYGHNGNKFNEICDKYAKQAANGSPITLTKFKI